MKTDVITGIAEEAARYRPVLYRLAVAQLRDPTAAEDATQETLLAVLEKGASFEGRSSLRTWLFSILRFKVLDIMRDQSKQRRRADFPAAGDHQPEDDGIAVFDVLFDAEGCWAESKDVWTDPHTVAERNAFFKVLEACMTKLPERSSRAFLMREWLELEPVEICSQLGISAGNLRILLYRARMQLRFCLEIHWERT
jgi:RNA polymerase sigma-70 factor (ECF subfamily)